VGGSQLGAAVRPSVVAAQPFAVEQVGPGQLGADPGAAETGDGLVTASLNACS